MYSCFLFKLDNHQVCNSSRSSYACGILSRWRYHSPQLSHARHVTYLFTTHHFILRTITYILTFPHPIPIPSRRIYLPYSSALFSLLASRTSPIPYSYLLFQEITKPVWHRHIDVPGEYSEQENNKNEREDNKDNKSRPKEDTMFVLRHVGRRKARPLPGLGGCTKAE